MDNTVSDNETAMLGDAGAVSSDVTRVDLQHSAHHLVHAPLACWKKIVTMKGPNNFCFQTTAEFKQAHRRVPLQSHFSGDIQRPSGGEVYRSTLRIG